jgi:flagellar biosynthesis protein FlhB
MIMEAIVDSWLFVVFMWFLVLLLLIKLFSELIYFLKKRKMDRRDLPEMSQKEAQLEYKGNIRSNFKLFLKWFFHLE